MPVLCSFVTTMDNSLKDMLLRLKGAAAVEEKVKEITLQSHRGVPHCMWDLDQGMSHAGQHRLDVCVAQIEIRLYFTDQELMSYPDEERQYHVNHRLQQALSKLFNH